MTAAMTAALVVVVLAWPGIVEIGITWLLISAILWVEGGGGVVCHHPSIRSCSYVLPT